MTIRAQISPYPNAVGEIGLNVPLIKLKYHEQMPSTTLDTMKAKSNTLSLRIKSVVKRQGGNFCWQGPKDWLFWQCIDGNWEKITK